MKILISVFIVGLVFVMSSGVVQAGSEGKKNCYGMAEKLDKVNQQIGTKTAKNVVEFSSYYYHPNLQQPMYATITYYVDAGWSHNMGGTPKRIEFENGDIWWPTSVTHNDLFAGADGSAFVYAWGSVTGTQLVCKTP